MTLIAGGCTGPAKSTAIWKPATIAPDVQSLHGWSAILISNRLGERVHYYA
jgi:hypothetical protein